MTIDLSFLVVKRIEVMYAFPRRCVGTRGVVAVSYEWVFIGGREMPSVVLVEEIATVASLPRNNKGGRF